MIEVKDPSEFEAQLKNQDVPIVLDFYTDTCNPCRSLAPILERAAHEFQGKAIFLKTNALHNPELAQQFGVKTVPTLIFIKNIESMERANGLVTEHSLRLKMNQLIG